MSNEAELNWSGTLEYRAADIVDATSIDQVASLVAGAERIRALGTRHSFSDIADTDALLVTVTDIDPDFVLDEEARTVTVGGGTRYGILARFLEDNGWALHNMGSLPHISIAGAITTGTHGSGNGNGVLSTAVSALELVVADGSRRVIRRGEPGFDGLVVGLGAFGVVVRVTLDIQPTFLVRQDVYRGLPWNVLLDDVEGVTSLGYSVSVFTDWVEETIANFWVKTRLDSGVEVLDEWHGAQRDIVSAGALWETSDNNLNEQGGVAGPWLERLPHFRLDRIPSNGDEIQTEYFVPRAQGGDALRALRALGPQIAPHLIITELRTAAADDLWLSMAYQRESLIIHFTWKNEPEAVLGLLPQIEEALAPFDARPHWGKLNTVDAAALDRVYPRLAEFRALAAEWDPTGAFRNDATDRLIFTDS
ncbi:D-arabinono-1,4-lactone oxidase [Agreia sp. COWG]|uniref:D-arabinono-1,4-lactone oxidase n=1 Tax=Agreia sp. COWG TaxID=2773266 RepID=UPI0019261E92|nr:D-arabinono-1,4-lactone oxidase [Agreia sp. COWG]CAD5990180.1 putative xylitol oxidase [Agreia sp. COWG]